MTLLSLPAELRLRIYDYLPDLQPHRHELHARSQLTPSICQTCHGIRKETLPLYAENTIFILQIDDMGKLWNKRLACLLDGLGPNSISRIGNIQISRHWSIPQPQRWQGHVGFYVRIERCRHPESSTDSSANLTAASSFRPEWNTNFVRPFAEGAWEITTGTYPVARDMRGMRLQSVDLLGEVVRHRLHPKAISSISSGRGPEDGLRRDDIEFLLHAMDVVASHPISIYSIEQPDSARRRSHQTWSSMEEHLRALDTQATSSAVTTEPNVSGVFPSV